MPQRFARKGATNSVAPFALRLLLLCILSLCGPCTATAAACPAEHTDERVQVIHVFDGDTVQLQDGRRVRLIGINTPEMGHGDRRAEPVAAEARASLQTLLDNHNRILLLKHGSEAHDHYGRLLAHAFLENGDNVAALLLQRGLATTLVVPPNTWAMDCYRRLEDTARIERTGLWALEKYQSRASKELPPGTSGYAIVHGTVTTVRQVNQDLWVDLEGPLALHIGKRERVNFAPGYLEQLQGRTVEARGWIKSGREGLRMNIQHPAALAVITMDPR